MNKAAIVKTLNLCVVFAVPPVIALVIYATYIFNVKPLDATLSFTILSLFNTLRCVCGAAGSVVQLWSGWECTDFKLASGKQRYQLSR